METAHTPRWAHLRRLALCAVGVAFAWIALVLTLGLGSTASHAADDEGALDPVTSALDGLLVAATGTVDAVASPAADLVGDTVESVTQVLPAPVREPVGEVVDAVGGVADAVTDTVDSVPVSTVTGTLVDTVTAVPVVGDVVAVLGVDTAVTDIGESVDGALGTTTTTVDTVVDAVLPAPAPVEAPPALPVPDDTDALPAIASTASSSAAPAAPATEADVVLDVTASAPRYAWVAWQPAALTAAPWAVAANVVGTVPPDPASDAPGPPAGPCLSPAAPSGAAGSSATGSSALPPSGSLDDHRAWGRSALSGDDDVPASPAAPLDVSPD